MFYLWEEMKLYCVIYSSIFTETKLFNTIFILNLIVRNINFFEIFGI